MCRCEFIDKTKNEVWVFLENYAEKDQQWKSIHVPPRVNPRGILSIDPSSFPVEDPQVFNESSHVNHLEQANALG